MDAKPSVFVGSSSEHLDIANTVQELLDRDATVTVWDRAFDLGSGTLESLEQELDRADFAVLILAPDDVTESRDSRMDVPRDNVLFELGLFIGRLGRDRAYYLYDSEIKVKLPSDLAGVTGASYTRSRDWLTALGPACNKIRRRLAALQARPKLDPATLEAFAHHQAFRESLHGSWWEFLLSADQPSVSFVSIEPDAATSTVRLRGNGYATDGALFAVWESIGSILHVAERRVCYTWKGWFMNRPDEPYEGFGDIVFADPKGSFDRGTGTYFNINLAKLQTTGKVAFRMFRCSAEEIETMQSGDEARVRGLVGKKLMAV